MSALSISQMSSASGVPATTLRFYESEGLLPTDRAPNGYRVYGERAQQRLAFITAAKTLNMTLPQIRSMLQAWESESCSAVKARLRPALRGHIAQAEKSIAQLTVLRDALTGALDGLDDTPDAGTPCDPQCSWLASTTATSATVS